MLRDYINLYTIIKVNFRVDFLSTSTYISVIDKGVFR